METQPGPSSPEENNDDEISAALNKEFEVSAVTRLDLIEAGFPHQLVLAVSDEDMQKIARKMGEAYTENGYWEDLNLVVSLLLGVNAEQTDC